jgi:ribosomal protein S14
MVSILQKAIKEKKQRLAFRGSEIERRYIKLLKMHAVTLGYMPIRTMPKYHFKNYCLVSGSPKSVYAKNLRLSRHKIRAYFSYLRGLRISSW